MGKFTEYLSQNAPRILYVNVAVEFIVIASLGTIATLDGKCGEQWNTVEAYRWASVILSFGAQFYFAYHSIVKHNITELLAFLIVSVLTAVCFYIKVVMLWPTCSQSTLLEYLMILLSFVILANQAFYVLSARIVYENFRWKIFKMTVDDKVQKMIQNLEEFKAMLKVNMLLQMLIFLGYFMFIDFEYYRQHGTYFWFIIDAVLLFFYVLVTRIGFISAESKNKARNIKIFLGYLTMMQIYELVKFWPLFDVASISDIDFTGEKYAIIISQIVIGLAGIGTQIYTTIIARRYYKDADIIHENADNQTKLIEDNNSESNY